jgi:hypothetical protein
MLPSYRRELWFRRGLGATGAGVVALGVYWYFAGPLGSCLALPDNQQPGCEENEVGHRHFVGLITTLGGVTMMLVAYWMGDRAPSDTEIELLVHRRNARLRRKLLLGAETRAGLWIAPAFVAGGASLALGGTF